MPAANLNIGGYFKGSYNRPEGQRETLQLDDLSLFITWTPHARLRFFSEIEQHNWINNDGVENFVDKLNVERLFVDFLITDAVSARFGKFLTPFGRWNVIHSAPLVWTTNRPVVTDNFSSPFALRANGLMLNYTHIVNEHNLDVSIYLDNSTNLEPKSFNNVIFDQAAGLRVNYEVTEELQLGFSYLSYKALKDQVDQGLPIHHLLGVDFLWQHQGYELMFESLYHTLDGAGQKLEEKGMYLQGVVPLGGKVSAVARYEYFDTKELEKSLSISHIGVLGLAWRPYLPLVMKSEYRFGNNNGIIAPSGLFVSVAMFF
ncbi:MAG: hypothetical protein HOP02_15260 [Methylococcaceae bacterium]|nr:hypothetical protein [Methylococcaceae bacterium]